MICNVMSLAENRGASPITKYIDSNQFNKVNGDWWVLLPDFAHGESGSLSAVFLRLVSSRLFYDSSQYRDDEIRSNQITLLSLLWAFQCVSQGHPEANRVSTHYTAKTLKISRSQQEGEAYLDLVLFLLLFY